jgi:hypothetical protein
MFCSLSTVSLKGKQKTLFLGDKISELMPFKHMKSWNNTKQQQKFFFRMARG